KGAFCETGAVLGCAPVALFALEFLFGRRSVRFAYIHWPPYEQPEPVTDLCLRHPGCGRIPSCSLLGTCAGCRAWLRSAYVRPLAGVFGLASLGPMVPPDAVWPQRLLGCRGVAARRVFRRRLRASLPRAEIQGSDNWRCRRLVSFLVRAGACLCIPGPSAR